MDTGEQMKSHASSSSGLPRNKIVRFSKKKFHQDTVLKDTCRDKRDGRPNPEAVQFPGFDPERRPTETLSMTPVLYDEAEPAAIATDES